MVAPVSFKGVAHPRPDPRGRKTPADLSPAEIGTANLGKNGGLPLLVEHEHGARAGRVLASWEGRNGELRVAGVVDCPEAARDVRSGAMRGLSLGTGVILDHAGHAMGRTQDELSLCVEPKRTGCYIDSVDGRDVRPVSVYSNKGAPAHASAPPSSLTLPARDKGSTQHHCQSTRSQHVCRGRCPSRH